MFFLIKHQKQYQASAWEGSLRFQLASGHARLAKQNLDCNVSATIGKYLGDVKFVTLR